MNEKRPYIVTFIGDIFLLSAILSLIIVIFPDFIAKLGFHMMPIPIFSVRIMSILLPTIALIASCGYLRLKKWGYWLIVIYCVFFLVVNIIWCLISKQLYLSLNFIFILIELIFIIPTKNYFDKKISSS